jgi:methyltransferase (TIGR00027 family)
VDVAEASRTAVLVCQGRAVAQGRIAVDRFADPTAMPLLRADERPAVEQARSGVVPRVWGDRMEFEMLRATAEVMVPRTVRIDDAVRERRAPQLVILGAGLDGRAWRMEELASVDVFEVDHPASQQDKRDRTQGLPPPVAPLRFVPVDFTRDRLDVALASAGHRESVATTWIWEGVVPYLTRAEVEATMRVVGDRSAPGSRLIVNYQAPALVAAVGRVMARAMALTARRRDPLAQEPRRSSWTPAAMADLLTGHDFTVGSDGDLLTFAADLGLAVKNRRSVRIGRIAVADR